MRYIYIFLWLSIAVSSTQVNAQNPTWADDIAPVIYENCSYCHRANGIGPFNLLSYSNVLDHANTIVHVLSEGEMPPWPADPNYRRFAFEEILSVDEEQAILDWMANGFEFGNPANEPSPPVFSSSGSNLTTIDFVLAIEPYTLQSNTDEYRWFVVENPYSDTIYVNKIEVIPGLNEVVHHADISYDNTSLSLNNDIADPLPGFNNSTGSPNYSFYMNAWQPGGNIATYPDGWGIAVPPGSDFVLEIHYGPGGIGLTDTTKMNLQFVTSNQDVRAVQVGWLLGQNPPTMLDGPLVIPADEIVTFHQEYTLTEALSLISICPHMHLLGKSYKVWAVTPANDTIRLIDVPNWDIHWQKYYMFREIQVLTAGTTIYSEGVYDNTLANHDNPFNPPQPAQAGTTTLDEMFLCYFIYAPYASGDENVILDDSPLVNIETSIAYQSIPGYEVNIYPNPATDILNIDLEIDGTVTVSDALGRVLLAKRSSAKTHRIELNSLPAGVYFLNITSQNIDRTEVFVKH